MIGKFKRNGLSRNKDGWTKAQWEAAQERQGGCCAICGDKVKLCSDHTHADPPVPRELLCRTCNSGLGMFRDNPRLLVIAAQYLVEHTPESYTRLVLSKHGDHLEDRDGVLVP
jgi:hypothetical protein